MAAKRVRISDDSGANWYTLPGNSGEMRRELATVDSTVFGETFKSEDVSIGMWMVSAQAFFKNIAGYTAVLKQGGTPTSMSNEATTFLSGKSYQITNVARRVISFTNAVTVFDGANNVTNQVLSIDYLAGIITFRSTYTVGGAVTVTGHFIPMLVLARAKAFNLTQTADEIDETDYAVAQANGGWRVYRQGLKTITMEVSGIYDTAAAYQTALASRAIMYVEVSPDAGPTVFRGLFKRSAFSQQGDVGALEESTLNLSLYVPDSDLLAHPFKWYFAGNSTLNIAVRKCLEAWQSDTAIRVRYLPNGTTGYSGDAIITECSVANTLEGTNEFRFSFRGSGTPATV